MQLDPRLGAAGGGFDQRVERDLEAAVQRPQMPLVQRSIGQPGEQPLHLHVVKQDTQRTVIGERHQRAEIAIIEMRQRRTAQAGLDDFDHQIGLLVGGLRPRRQRLGGARQYQRGAVADGEHVVVARRL